jgi:hypothetical protein
MMTEDRKAYSRYVFNCGLRTLWKGDASNAGARFRSIALTTDAFANTEAIYQVYALEGIGKGIVNGKFAGTTGDTKVIYDKDFEGMTAAVGQFNGLVHSAREEGFKPIDFLDWLEFESSQSKKRASSVRSGSSARRKLKSLLLDEETFYPVLT